MIIVLIPVILQNRSGYRIDLIIIFRTSRDKLDLIFLHPMIMIQLHFVKIYIGCTLPRMIQCDLFRLLQCKDPGCTTCISNAILR